MILFSGLLVYTLNNGVLSTLDILGHLLVTLLVCLIPYLVGFRLFHTYSGIIRYSSFVDLQKVGFAVLFGLICVVVFQALTDFSPYLMYIRKRDLILSALLAMSLMWMMRVFVKFFYVSTFRVAKAERAFIYGVKQGGVSLAKSIQNQDPARFVLAGFICNLIALFFVPCVVLLSPLGLFQQLADRILHLLQIRPFGEDDVYVPMLGLAFVAWAEIWKDWVHVAYSAFLLLCGGCTAMI